MLNSEQQKSVEENHSLIYWYINLKHLDIEEWYDLLAIELCNTILKYKPEKGSLSNYFKMRADNLVKKQYSKTQLKKNKCVEPLTYNDEIYQTTTDDLGIIDNLDDFFNGENNEIFTLRVKGYTQSEIAAKLGVTQSYISKIIDRKRKEYYDLY